MKSEMNSSIEVTDFVRRVGEAALLGMLYEISAYPSPGLVSPVSNGAHADMDFFKFLRSTSAINVVMHECTRIGIEEDGNLLDKIRKIGLAAENRMFEVTDGVNTQKGILFLAGIVCCASGCCFRKGKDLNRYSISEQCKNMCRGIIEKELGSIKTEQLTNSGKVYSRFGVSGIRGEVANGLQTVLETGLPYYEASLKSGLHVRDALVNSLIAIMSVIEDTTVLNRCGLEGIELMHAAAKAAIELGGMQTHEGRKFINDMDDMFILKNISPGGAADLLAVTVMINEIEKIR